VKAPSEEILVLCQRSSSVPPPTGRSGNGIRSLTLGSRSPSPKPRPQSRQSKEHLPYSVSNSLLFMHAMTGCDTTSAVYRQGKKKAFNILLKNQELREQVTKVFNDPTSSPDTVSSVGETVLLAPYDASKTTSSLNVHRHERFMKAVVTCPVQNKIELANYHQLLQQRGNIHSEFISKYNSGWDLSCRQLNGVGN